jgi:hypothetical protein
MAPSRPAIQSDTVIGALIEGASPGTVASNQSP